MRAHEENIGSCKNWGKSESLPQIRQSWKNQKAEKITGAESIDWGKTSVGKVTSFANFSSLSRSLQFNHS